MGAAVSSGSSAPRHFIQGGRAGGQLGTTTILPRTRLVDLGRCIGAGATTTGMEQVDSPIGLLREVRGMAPELMDEVSEVVW